MNHGLSRYIPRKDDVEYKRSVVLSAYQIAIPTAVVAGLVVVLFSDEIAVRLFNDPSVGDILWIFGLAIPFAVTVQVGIGTIQGLQLSVPKVAVRNVTQPLTRFLLVGAVVFYGFGKTGMAWAYAGGHIAAALLLLYYVFNHLPLLERKPWTRMHSELLTFSLPLVVTSAMVVLLSRVDSFMLGVLATTGDVGVYGVVYPMAELLTAGLASFGFLFTPILSELHADQELEEMRRLCQVVTKWIFMVTLHVFMILTVFPEITISLSFGAEYADGSLALTNLAFGFFSHAVLGPNVNALTSIGRTRMIMYDNVVVTALSIALNILLIPQFTYIGAAVATTVSYVFLNILYTVQIHRVTGIHPFTAAMVRPGIIAAISIATIYLLTNEYLSSTPLTLFANFFVFIVVYTFGVLSFWGIKEEEIDLLLQMEDRFGVDLSMLKKVVVRVMK
ncbi:flippase [Halobacterium noricense]